MQAYWYDSRFMKSQLMFAGLTVPDVVNPKFKSRGWANRYRDRLKLVLNQASDNEARKDQIVETTLVRAWEGEDWESLIIVWDGLDHFLERAIKQDETLQALAEFLEKVMAGDQEKLEQLIAADQQDLDLLPMPAISPASLEKVAMDGHSLATVMDATKGIAEMVLQD